METGLTVQYQVEYSTFLLPKVELLAPRVTLSQMLSVWSIKIFPNGPMTFAGEVVNEFIVHVHHQDNIFAFIQQWKRSPETTGQRSAGFRNNLHPPLSALGRGKMQIL